MTRSLAPSGESTTTECGVNYQLLSVITEVAQWGTPELYFHLVDFLDDIWRILIYVLFRNSSAFK